ncbi:tetratricopeptide repeat protein [Micromonospora sp. DH14]|uniref:tetratricopeptide repeat protein n=1 Tax=Micromonospora sp. DH14 TaxID=3040120 RepID=UPI0024410E11|nr:tetratricopeptide repeat protein [Micromonospora sp. DH14]MDG9672455.1 tetratricopeptide repeat protein [Micromonospora sp. DH14]
MEPQSGNGDDAVARARELVRAEQFGPAIELLREHLNAHPDDGIAWRRLAGALIGLGEHAAAVDAAGRAIDIDPEDVAAYRYRALALLMLKRDGESAAASTAGIVAAGASYGATRGVPTAAVLGLTAVAISGAFGLLLLLQQRRRIAGGAYRSGSL